MDQEKIAIAQTQLKALGMQREQDIISLKQAEDTQTHIKVVSSFIMLSFILTVVVITPVSLLASCER